MKLHFIQDEATPHNNLLIKELSESPDIELTLWYAREESKQYTWTQNLTHDIQQAHIYGDKSIHWSLIFHLLIHRDEKVFQVGWANPTTRILVTIFFLSRRPYNMWTDYPRDAKKRNLLKNSLRELFYWMLKHSRAHVFCVGRITLDYFAKRGFATNRLFNLPILIDTSKSKTDYHGHRERIRQKFQVDKDDLFLVAGSRLIHEKGYDLLIRAISMLPDEKKKRVKTLIIGRGEEQENLLKQIRDEGLSDKVFIEKWMDVEEYQAHVANADVFVHPARFDAYGGTIYALIVGTPVIGSRGAGAAVDRIIDGQNGYLFDVGDINSLMAIIHNCFLNRDSLRSMGLAARKSSEKWHPSVGVKIIKRGII